MAFHFPVEALTLSLFFTGFFFRGTAAIRGTDGCYDEYPMSCDRHKVPLEDIDFDLQEVCNEIILTVLQWNYLVLNVSSHPPFLNTIDPSDEFCPRMQKAYSHCSFCLPRPEFEDCFFKPQENIRNCTGLPTREEVILDNNKYGRFKTEEDIDATCDQLVSVYDNYMYPQTIDLCDTQELLLHLCPGNCHHEASCFKEPPTCQPDRNTSLLQNANQSLGWGGICRDLYFYGGIHRLDNEDLFDASKRSDMIFGKISEDDPLCPDYQKAYPHCFWCSESPDSLCFSKTKPPSCEEPDAVDAYVDVDMTCQQIYRKMHLFELTPSQAMNASIHSKILFIFEDDPLCRSARQVYHKCLWCDPEIQNGLSIENWNPCLSNLTVPEDYETVFFAYFNISGNGTSPTKEDCATLERYFDGEAFTIDAAYLKIIASRLCPKDLCKLIPPPPKTSMNYLGTTSDAQRKALIWISRSAAFLSFLGASYILFDILTNRKARKTVYHQILVGWQYLIL